MLENYLVLRYSFTKSHKSYFYVDDGNDVVSVFERRLCFFCSHHLLWPS